MEEVPALGSIVSESKPAVGVWRREISTRELLRFALIFSAAMIPYLNTLGNGFVFDDNLQVLQNPYIRNFHYIGAIFGSNVWSFISTKTMTNYYRPLMTVQYLITYHFFGKMAYPYHLLNVLMNFGVVLLVYALTRRMFSSKTIATITAVLFAVYPIHSEVVAWVAAVPDLQMTIFILAAFWFFLDIGEPGRRRWWTWPMLSLCFSCALLSKEPAIMLPAVAVVYEHFYRDGASTTALRVKLQRYIPLWGISGVYLICRFAIIGALARSVHVRLPWFETILTANALAGEYVAKLVWPFNLSAVHDLRAARMLLDAHFLAGIACVAALSGAAWFLWKRKVRAGFGLPWMFLFLMPALNTRWMVSVSYSERYLYLPSVGFCWLAAVAIEWCAKTRSSRNDVWLPRLALAGGGALCVLLGYKIVIRNRVWHDDVAFYESTTRENPEQAWLRTDLGTAYARIGQIQSAIAEWNTAVSIDPKNFLALSNLGNAFVARKRYAEALGFYDRAIQANPSYSDAHYGRAQAFERQGLTAQAEAEYRLTLEIAPLDVDARNDYAKFCVQQGRDDEATAQYRAALGVYLNSTSFDGLGDIALRQQDKSKAQLYFEQAEQSDSYDHHAHYQLAVLYAEQRRSADAHREFELGYKTDIGTDPLEAVAKVALKQGSNPSN